MLLRVIGSCCAKFETGQSFSPVQTDATLLANNVCTWLTVIIFIFFPPGLGLTPAGMMLVGAYVAAATLPASLAAAAGAAALGTTAVAVLSAGLGASGVGAGDFAAGGTVAAAGAGADAGGTAAGAGAAGLTIGGTNATGWRIGEKLWNLFVSLNLTFFSVLLQLNSSSQKVDIVLNRIDSPFYIFTTDTC